MLECGIPSDSGRMELSLSLGVDMVALLQLLFTMRQFEAEQWYVRYFVDIRGRSVAVAAG